MPDMSAADNETATGATAPISPVMSSSVGNKLGLGLLWLVALLGVAGSALLWQKLSRMQEQLARQSADAGQQSVEVKAWAKQAQETVKDNTARLAQAEGKLAELGLQRTQIEELMQSMSRSRDENLVLDIESSLRLAQQQADMTGNAEPLWRLCKPLNCVSSDLHNHVWHPWPVASKKICNACKPLAVWICPAFCCVWTKRWA